MDGCTYFSISKCDVNVHRNSLTEYSFNLFIVNTTLWIINIIYFNQNKMKIKQINETLFEVGIYSVKIQTKKGRKLLLCSCSNSSRFAEKNWCYHKQRVIEYITKQPIKQLLNQLIINYEGLGNMKVDSRVFLDDLNKIMRLVR